MGKIKIVKFGNGLYGIRKFDFMLLNYEYRLLKTVNEEYPGFCLPSFHPDWQERRNISEEDFKENYMGKAEEVGKVYREMKEEAKDKVRQKREKRRSFKQKALTKEEANKLIILGSLSK